MSEDIEFMSNLNAAVRERGRKESRLLLYVIVVTLAWVVFWAHHAKLDEVTRGDGTIIPSSKVQVVQNLEGGIVSEILVKAGDRVEKEQPLLKIDNKHSESSFDENVAHAEDLRIHAARLQAEIAGTDLTIDPALEKARPDLAAEEKSLFLTNMSLLKSQLQVLELQIQQKKDEIAETEGRIVQLEKAHELLNKQIALTRPLVQKKIESEIEFLRLEREGVGILERLQSARDSIPRLRSSILELEQKRVELQVSFRTRAQRELTEAIVEIRKIELKKSALEDQVTRTLVKSPIRGIVKQVLVSTVGGVIRPGMDLVEIVPVEDALIAEIRLRPSDIAFLHPGLKAVVKVTAYDFSIYGGLDGSLVHIGADTLKDERGQDYYQVWIKTEKSYLGKDPRSNKIIPGMTVTADIMTGKKSVLQYVLKPLLRARENALRER